MTECYLVYSEELLDDRYCSQDSTPSTLGVSEKLFLGENAYVEAMQHYEHLQGKFSCRLVKIEVDGEPNGSYFVVFERECIEENYEERGDDEYVRIVPFKAFGGENAQENAVTFMNSLFKYSGFGESLDYFLVEVHC